MGYVLTLDNPLELDTLDAAAELEYVGVSPYSVSTPACGGRSEWRPRQCEVFRCGASYIVCTPSGVWAADRETRRVLHWFAALPVGSPLPDYPPFGNN